MKQMLIGVIALTLGATAFAGETKMDEKENHLYLKAGANVFSKYSNVVYDDAKYSNVTEDSKWSDGKTKGFGWEIAIEGTRDVIPNLELGLGLAYQRNNKFKEYGYKDGDASLVGKYDLLPLYVIGKYNFYDFNGLKPYAKINVGYSFGFNANDVKHIERGVATGETKEKVNGGAYLGAGMGVEYNNFLLDLSYSMNFTKAKFSFKDEVDRIVSFKKNLNYSKVTLSVGYKFDF